MVRREARRRRKTASIRTDDASIGAPSPSTLRTRGNRNEAQRARFPLAPRARLLHCVGMTKTRAPVMAAGGIVMRGTAPPLIAIVRLSKDRSWVLPKGKLKFDEDALAAARREVLEETGHEVA